jgi:predicted nucleic acid-binding protein
VRNIWVVNASPVITLAKAGHLTLLTALADEVLLPVAVIAELLAAPASDPARQAIEQGWGNHISPVDVPAIVLEWGLGAGETAVIAAALESQERTAVLDDAQGRKCARALGVPVIGTLGVVLRAKKMGHVPSATNVLRDLRDAGLYLDSTIIAAAIEQSVGENWRP